MAKAKAAMARSKLEDEVLSLTNAFRTKEGQTPLQMHEAEMMLRCYVDVFVLLFKVLLK